MTLQYPFSFRGDRLAEELACFVVREPITRVVTYAGSPAWLVTGHELVRQALKDPRLSRSKVSDPAMPREDKGPPPPMTVVGTMRLLEGAGLREEAARGMSPHQTDVPPERVREISDALLEAMTAAGRPGDLVADFALPWAAQVTCELLGLPREHAGEVAGWFGLVRVGAGAERHLEAEWMHAIDRIIAWAPRPGGDGLLGRLLALNERSPAPLDQETMTDLMVFLVLSGLTNPAAFVAAAGLRLARDPALRDRLVAEPERLGDAVDEMYRWSVMLGDAITRIALEDVRIGDVLVRADEMLLLSIDSANRDPAVFEDPDRLDIDRPRVQNLRFGRGRHYCPGAALTRAQSIVALESLLTHMPKLRLAVPSSDIEWRPDHAVLMPESVPVRW
ncbi:cytochrome P450 [Spirillospora sp. NPDC127200]